MNPNEVLQLPLKPDGFRPDQEDWKKNVDSIQLAASSALESQFEKEHDKEIILERGRLVATRFSFLR